MGRVAPGHEGPAPERREHPHGGTVSAPLGCALAGGAVLHSRGVCRPGPDRRGDGVHPRPGEPAHAQLLPRLGAGACGQQRAGGTLMATSTKPVRNTLDPDTAASYHQYLRQMLLIRHFEEKAGEAYSLGKIGGVCHLYIGQEAGAVGAISALRPDDYITSAYREHGQALARGMTARAVMAELFGKATGCSHGKGGSMHLFDASLGFLGGHAIVGSHIPIAAGAAFAIKYRGGNQVSVCFFGEAAANIGAFHETLNMASLWDLPALFICENNGYGMGTAVSRASAVQNLSVRGNAYDMPA